AASQHENPTRTSKLPSERVVLLVLGSLLAAALIIIYRLYCCSDLFIDEKYLKCEAGWELHGGKCYFFSNNTSTWTESRDSCRGQGGDLVKIDSREEKLKEKFANGEDSFWIGLTDSEKEDSWVWVDGSPLKERSDCSQNIWSEQPDDLSYGHVKDADCVRMGLQKKVADLRTWFDISCNQTQKSICEKSAKAGQSSCVFK
uniref:C-type lectin domain-containing protein n=1 Tax=Cyprinodon variegatus TaxID=28743 RepID=A0A3Q2CPG6_CYPVA